MKNAIYLTLRQTKLIFVLGAILLSSSCSQSRGVGEEQKTSSMIEGQLVDQRGRPVSQYAVRCESVDNLSVQSTVAFTDFSGNFQFLNLPPGKYNVYPMNETADQSQIVEVTGGAKKNIGTVALHQEIKVELNKDAAKTINQDAAKTINPDAAKTINTEAAKTINPEAAKTINPEAAKTINPEAAKTINPEAAKVLNPQRAMYLTREQARTLTVEEARKPIAGP
jgi:hypothetical protein